MAVDFLIQCFVGESHSWELVACELLLSVNLLNRIWERLWMLLIRFKRLMWNRIRVKRLLRRPIELAWLHILTHISTHFNKFRCISIRFKRFRFISAHFQRLRLDKKFLESAHLGASIFIWLMGNRFINQLLKQICVAELILMYVWGRAR
jgi:hypothetical protein